MARKDGPLFPIFDWQRALLESSLPKETKTVGWALSTYTNKHGGNAHPGEALLAERLAPMTTRTVRTHLARLRAEGFILRVVRGSTAEHKRWADVYELTFPDETTGSGFPEVGDHRKPVSGDDWPDNWGAEADHRKSGSRPPETERTDHRKRVSAQQRMASTHTYKASASPDAASHTSVRGGSDPLEYNDPRVSDEERVDIVEDALGGYLGPGEEPAIARMIDGRCPLPYILNTIRSGRAEPAA